MDAAVYINSNAIREYLKEIGYSFNTLETAWLIYNCRRISYEEKKRAWMELISEMPDCIVPQRMNCKGWNSLHDLLRQYINITDHEIQEFYQEEHRGDFVYMYSYLYEDDAEWSEEYNTVYPSLKACQEAFQNDIERWCEIRNKNNTKKSKGTGVIKYRIRKQSLTCTKHVLELEFKGDEQVFSVFQNSARKEECEDIIRQSFEGLWFDIPTPFKKGDIVWAPADLNNIGKVCGGGFVLEELSSWNVPDEIRASGDQSDMNGCGYFLREDGTIYYEVMSNYMDLEYYDGPYKLHEKILPVLSKFVKGEITVDLLLCAYRKILLESSNGDTMLKKWYPAETLYELDLM